MFAGDHISSANSSYSTSNHFFLILHGVHLTFFFFSVRHIIIIMLLLSVCAVNLSQSIIYVSPRLALTWYAVDLYQVSTVSKGG